MNVIKKRSGEGKLDKQRIEIRTEKEDLRDKKEGHSLNGKKCDNHRILDKSRLQTANSEFCYSLYRGHNFRLPWNLFSVEKELKK